jgi:hypothetical protein
VHRPFEITYPRVLLLVTAVIPPFAHQFGLGASTGVILLSLLYISLGFLKRRITLKSGVKYITLLCFTFFFVYIFISGLLSFTLHQEFGLWRFGQSFLLLIICVLGGYLFTLHMAAYSNRQMDYAVRFVFFVLIGSAVAKLFGIHLLNSEKSVLFYNEPSHYALGIAPFLLYIAASDKKNRWYWIGLVILVGIYIQNLTIIVVAALCASIFLSWRYLFLIIALLVPITIQNLSSDGLLYYSSRLLVANDNNNLSNLVYLSGWERARISILDTYGLGYGLNQLGIYGSQGIIMNKLSALGVEDLNLLDGGSVASKMIAEFGIAALMAIALYFKYFLRGISFIRNKSSSIHEQSNCLIFFLSCFIMYSVDLFIRGTGYFSAESFMLFGAILGSQSLMRDHLISNIPPPRCLEHS